LWVDRVNDFSGGHGAEQDKRYCGTQLNFFTAETAEFAEET
jgi:hypothetical protein